MCYIIAIIRNRGRTLLDEPLKAASNSVQVFFQRLYAGKKKEKKT